MRQPLSRLVSTLIIWGIAGGICGAAEEAPPPQRLRVAVFAFADKTGDPQDAHWRYSLEALLEGQLAQVKAVRVLPHRAVEVATQQLKLRPGAAADVSSVRKLGERIEAQRVVWGWYRRDRDQWNVTARVLNVATGKASSELRAVSSDWFAVRDRLTEQILRELGITPSATERARMVLRDTTSLAAWEWLSKAMALRSQRRPSSAQEALLRQALAADSQFARAYRALAMALFEQGKFADAERAGRQALQLQPDDGRAHMILGVSQLLQNHLVDGEKELREAHRLDPDDTETVARLGELYRAQEKWDEAITMFDTARRLNPIDADIHANLGLTYVAKHERARALAELKEAARLDPEAGGAEQMISQAYDALGETPLAVEHYEKFVTQARKKGINPELVRRFERRAQELKSTLTPTFIIAAMPKVYNDQSLQAALRQKLTPKELAVVLNPLASSPPMKRWAQQLTGGAMTDLGKAKRLFEALARSDYGADGLRTAREVFVACIMLPGI
jgi:tetratricopeptide (TPR) repeat protein